MTVGVKREGRYPPFLSSGKSAGRTDRHHRQKEIKRSLKTGDRKEAHQRIDIEAAKLKQEFSDARRKLSNQPQKISELSETDLQRIVLLWFHRAESQSAKENFHTLTAEEFAVISDNLNYTEAAL